MERTANRDQVKSSGYDHSKFRNRRRFSRFLLRTIGFTLLAKLNRVEGLENVPSQGPALLMINHISFIDPFVVIHILPRNIVPLAKIEVYDYPIVGIFPKLWGVIPVRREEFDRHAVKQVLEVLSAGEIVLVAPEGTRGQQLQIGKEGVAYLASKSGVPVVPVAIDGTPGFPALRGTAPWRGPGAFVRFGKPFCYLPEYRHANREQLRKMTDEAMYILASLLPPHRRGVYADLSKASQETLELCP
ncbi:MAG: lysophospholipid acyltransferase family protein [Anaerolineales bacterium]